ncbi:hypothetical protein CLAFUW4_20103 [Fulvia fulva]|uniref:uncharacterized protein n=1 Tax=Passalora fulva TaxID=5499 RepID=UPI002852776B|nr:uncharacterized protein CLAFUR5_20103 [Fulvia fulva]KAK4610145.1 hypothetical protein CLAFUR4_20103 [Fulvia fulva]KAK4611192.1 hypothetical protein CLAFUR0_20103 [Fulvia fulva]WMI39067.1 hypothetical protein CLAFUR5_20103 [Fulvia fulva]WPV22353.1 hypothetical protein CLAFUW4_20103 [Fulvia fulva]WPV36692.1 hypothetical protein CLAFUW7_20103 [Fulvia fulva]
MIKPLPAFACLMWCQTNVQARADSQTSMPACISFSTSWASMPISWTVMQFGVITSFAAPASWNPHPGRRPRAPSVAKTCFNHRKSASPSCVVCVAGSARKHHDVARFELLVFIPHGFYLFRL